MRPVSALWILTLAVACWWAPGPVYLVALGVFGLPHVLWEVAWIRKSRAVAFPPAWWWGLGAVLLVQMVGRTGSWLGVLDASWALAVDLLTLALAVALVAGMPGATLAGRLLALALATGLVVIGGAGDVPWALPALMLLSLVHNFTPVWLVGLARRPTPSTVRGLRMAFVLPFLLLLLPPPAATTAVTSMPAWWPVELMWISSWAPDHWRAAFSAMVLAQCLHYDAVLRVLPSVGPVWQRPGARVVAIVACGVAAIGFAADFTGTRAVYGIAAGAHAWLEWPILVAMLAGGGRTQAAASGSLPTGDSA